MVGLPFFPLTLFGDARVGPKKTISPVCAWAPWRVWRAAWMFSQSSCEKAYQVMRLMTDLQLKTYVPGSSICADRQNVRSAFNRA